MKDRLRRFFSLRSVEARRRARASIAEGSPKAPSAEAPGAFFHHAVIVRCGPLIYPNGRARPGFRRFL
jgi:hypothetical protein